MSRRLTEWTIAGLFLLAAAAAGGFVAAYLVDAGTQWYGFLLALSCAALAVGFFVWSARLLPGGTFVEERAPLPPVEDQAAMLAAAERGREERPGIVRRALLLAGLGLAAAVVVPLRSLIYPRSATPWETLASSPWREGVRLITREGRPVRATEVPEGTAITVFPEGFPEDYDATTIVIGLAPLVVPLLPERIAAGVAAERILAYSKLCTHAGCPVGLYEETTQQLMCPCHQSVFSVTEAGRPVSGPAARPLPQLPLAVDEEGYLVATGDFDGQSGPSYWRPV